MTDVFISYSRGDRDKVRLIAAGLTAEGFSVWWDPEIQPGKKWNNAIRKSLEDAAAVVTCWSKKSVKSDWVLAETTRGYDRKVLVQVFVQPCSPPMPYNILQASDLSHWKGDADDPQWVEVLRQVRALVEAKRRYPAPPPPGEAEAGEGRPGPSSSGGESYRPSTTRGRMGPRLSQLALGAVVAGAVLAGGLWGVDKFAKSGGGAPPAIEVPLSAAPPATETPPSPAPAAPPSDAPVDDSQEAQGLDGCLQHLVAACDVPQPTGFAMDSGFSPEETKFLSAVGVSASRPIGKEAVVACETQLHRSQAAGVGGTPGLEAACGTLTPSAPQPVADPDKADDALDGCFQKLVSLCPATAPSGGFAFDGRVSAQERALLQSAVPSGSGDATKDCTAAVGYLAPLSNGNRAELPFGRKCRELAKADAAKPNFSKFKAQLQTPVFLAKKPTPDAPK